MKKLAILVCTLFLFQNCKKSSKDEQKAISIELDSIPKVSLKAKSIDYSLPDSILIEKIVADQKKYRYSYSSLKKVDTVKVEILYPADSTFKIINILGSVQEKTLKSPFSENMIIKNNRKVANSIDGYIFRIDDNNNGMYTLYSNDLTNPKNGSKIFEATFKKDSLIATVIDNDKNFYFNLLLEKKINLNASLSEKFFKVRKHNKFNIDPILSNNQKGKTYKINAPFFTIPTPLDIQPYYLSIGDTTVYKKLLIKQQDSIISDIELAGTGKSFKAYGEFINDSIFKHTRVNESLLKDNTHIVAYRHDSIVTFHSYNKAFHFKKIKKDAYKYEKEYPQYYSNLKDSSFYVWGSVFELNKIPSHWRYKVKYTDKTSEDSKEIYVKVLQKELISKKSGKPFFEYPIGRATNMTANIKFLDNGEADVQKLDINADGYTDLNFSKGKSSDGNEEFAVYLYNPLTGNYDYSKPLSGTSITGGIKTDNQKKIAIYSRKNGDNLYSTIKMYFDKKGSIASKEIFWNTIKPKNDSILVTVNYQRLIGAKIVEKRTDTIKEKGWGLNTLKDNFLKWADAQTP